MTEYVGSHVLESKLIIISDSLENVLHPCSILDNIFYLSFMFSHKSSNT